MNRSPIFLLASTPALAVSTATALDAGSIPTDDTSHTGSAAGFAARYGI